jgi:hypothetical protein
VTARLAASADDVVEIDGMLWKPVPGAQASAVEFEAARSLVLEVHDLARWNPWVETERAAELDAAVAVMAQWTRAEPDFRTMTKQEVDERLARMDAAFKRRWAEREQQRTTRAEQYDERRHLARLQLLEQQSILSGAPRRTGGPERRDQVSAYGPAAPGDQAQRP